MVSCNDGGGENDGYFFVEDGMNVFFWLKKVILVSGVWKQMFINVGNEFCIVDE